MAYIPMKRTFEAARHPKGSAERARLNLSSLTSEYMPSYKYVLVDENGKATPWTCRSKAEATDKSGDLIEKELRDLWNQQGISKEQQDRIISDATRKAQPGEMVGPFRI